MLPLGDYMVALGRMGQAGIRALVSEAPRDLVEQAAKELHLESETLLKLAQDAFKGSELRAGIPGKSPWGEIHALGGTSKVDALPAVSPRQAKLGAFGNYDNNLSAMGEEMIEHVKRAGPQSNEGFVSQSTDPKNKTTLRILDQQGQVPYMMDGDKSASDPAVLQAFVRDHLFGATGGTSSGPHDLLLEDHGGAIWGWSQTTDKQSPFNGKLMAWKDTIDAIANGLPAGSKLRALILNMCMTGGSSEAAVEAASRRVADVMVGSEDIAQAGAIKHDKLLKALDANPQMTGKDVVQTVMKMTISRTKNARFLETVGIDLDPKKAEAYTSAFKNLADQLKAKGQASTEVRQAIRQAFQRTKPLYMEGASGEDFRNHDVRTLMQRIRYYLKDSDIAIATRQVDAAHDAMLIGHQENPKEGLGARGLSVHAPAVPWGDGDMHILDGGFAGQDYRQTAFDRATGWSGVLEMVNADQPLVQQGMAAIKAHRPHQAVSLLKQALAENPDNTQAQTYLGQILTGPQATRQEGVGLLVAATRKGATIPQETGLFLAKALDGKAKEAATSIGSATAVELRDNRTPTSLAELVGYIIRGVQEKKLSSRVLGQGRRWLAAGNAKNAIAILEKGQKLVDVSKSPDAVAQFALTLSQAYRTVAEPYLAKAQTFLTKADGYAAKIDGLAGDARKQAAKFAQQADGLQSLANQAHGQK